MKCYVYGFNWRDSHGKVVGDEVKVKSHSGVRTHVSAEIMAHLPKPKPDCIPQILWREQR